MLTEINELLLCMNGALIGAVVPSLRAVSVDIDHEVEQVVFWFFYDGEISSDSLNGALETMQRMRADLLDDFQIQERIIRLDFPKRMALQVGDELVFQR